MLGNQNRTTCVGLGLTRSPIGMRLSICMRAAQKPWWRSSKQGVLSSSPLSAIDSCFKPRDWEQHIVILKANLQTEEYHELFRITINDVFALSRARISGDYVGFQVCLDLVGSPELFLLINWRTEQCVLMRSSGTQVCNFDALGPRSLTMSVEFRTASGALRSRPLPVKTRPSHRESPSHLQRRFFCGSLAPDQQTPSVQHSRDRHRLRYSQGPRARSPRRIDLLKQRHLCHRKPDPR
jgi:hypothetical protein